MIAILYDIGNIVLGLVGRKILTDEEIYLANIQEEKETKANNFENFKKQLGEKLIGCDDFVLTSFHLLGDTYNTQWQMRGVAVSKVVGVKDQYFSVVVDSEDTKDWTRMPIETMDSIIDEVTKAFKELKGELYGKENRDDELQDGCIKD